MKAILKTAAGLIAALTALAFVLIALFWTQQQAAFILGFIPARMSGVPIMWGAAPAFLTPLTATLVHSGLLHLGFNLLILVYCGLAVEKVLGRTGVVILYIAGAYVAAAAQWAAGPSEIAPMVGASGAVSAVIGAYSLSYGRARAVTRSPQLNRWLNALWLMVAWIALQLMTGYLAGAQGTLLATPAHIGGFLAGLLLQRPLLLWRYRGA